jgi:nicotinamidase-related amidase
MKNKLLLRNYITTLLVVDVQEKLIPHMFNKDEIIANLKNLIQGMNALEVPIVLTEQYPEGMGTTLPEISSLIPGIKAQDKITFSVMDSGKCVSEIGEPDEGRYIIITGVESHVCVLQTTLSLLEQGFKCGVVVDCVGSRSEKNYTFALKRMERAGADLLTTEMVLFELLKTAKHPAFKQILKLIK